MEWFKAIKLVCWLLLLVLLVAFGPGIDPTFGASGNSYVVRTVRVAVLDTGVDAGHILLKGKVVLSVNLSDSQTETDVHGHGTHVAGVIVSKSSNVELLNVKVAGDNGVVTPKALTRGILWSLDNGAAIINISLTVRDDDEELRRAVQEAVVRGVVVVAAAGNNGAASAAYPAAYPGVISVGALDTWGNIAGWSNGGSNVSAVAPGVGIISALPGDRWGAKSGTSQAAAMVTAGIAGHMGTGSLSEIVPPPFVPQVPQDTSKNGYRPDDNKHKYPQRHYADP